jgi:hypothetical protein
MWDPLISESIDCCGWDPPVSAPGASFSSLFSPVLYCQAQARRWWISRTRLRRISPAPTAADLARVSEVSEKGGSLEKRGRIAGEEREDRWPESLLSPMSSCLGSELAAACRPPVVGEEREDRRRYMLIACRPCLHGWGSAREAGGGSGEVGAGGQWW